MAGKLIMDGDSLSSKPKFYFGNQLEPLSPLREEPAKDKREGISWLVEAEACIQKDLETSKKELELIKGISEDIERRLAAQPPPNNKLRDQKILMSACQEYSRSRIHLLKQRLRQALFWSNNVKLGQKTPSQAPAEWRTGDLEWAQWLEEQAVARAGALGRASKGQEGANLKIDALWGPLPHILAAYIWHSEERLI